MIEPLGSASGTGHAQQADPELLRQKTYLDELFEMAPDAIVLTTLRNPRIVRINREFTLMFGYAAEEAVGQNLRNLIMPDELEPILPEDAELLAGQRIEREVVRRRKDGTRFHAHVTGKRIRPNDEGDAAYLIFRDITARKQADALFAGEKRLLEVIAAGGPLESTLDALCRLVEDVDGSCFASILLLDRGKRFRCGAAPSLPRSYVDALDGWPVGVGIAPCAAAAHLQEQVISVDLASDERWCDAYRALASANGIHACWSTPIGSSDGSVLGTFALYPRESANPTSEQMSRIEQLTHVASIAIEREQSIDALQRSEQRYSLAMEAAAEGHFDADLETGEMFVSARLNEIYNFPCDAGIVNRSEYLKQIPFHPDDRRILDDIIRPESVRLEWLGPAQDFFEYDCRIIPRPGDIRWIHTRGKVTRDREGRARRRAGVVADITERKRVEEALRLSEERYALAMQASEEGHFDWNVQTDEIFASEHLKEVLDLPAHAGYHTRGDLLTAQIPFHPDDRERIEETTREILAGAARHHEFECRLLHGQAREVRWIRSRWKIFRNAEGVAQRVIGVVSDITQRKRVEAALREQTGRLQLGQAAMRMIIMDWNVTEDLITWSDSPEWLRGPMPANGCYPQFRDQVHREDRDSFLATRRRALETMQVQTAEFRLVRTDEEVIWVLERKQAFADADGKPVRMLAAMFDITERKRAEDELRESEGRFRDLTALWSDWYWKQDEHLRFTYSTAAIDPPDGYPGGSAIGKTRWELPGIVPLSSSWDEHRELLASHSWFRDFEYSRPAADGTTRYVSTSGRPIFDEKGEFRGYHGVGRDITERKRVEEQLRSRQEMLEVAQKAARAVAFEWRADAGEDANRWSPDLEAMHGIAPGSYDGTYESWKKLVHPDDWPTIRDAIRTAQRTGEVDAGYRVLHASGPIRWLHVKGRMFFDSQGKITRVVGFMLDVTDRHLAEQELQRVERQLRQAQRLEALGTLAGGIAHDFNNLLGAILGYGEMALRNVRAGTRLRRDIENIMIAGERGHALVERILAFSRSGVGEQVAVHVEEVARETLALFTAKLPRHIVIERQLHAGTAAVMGDPTQIHQVLMNLLSNAVHAMASGGTLRVSLDLVDLAAPVIATTGSLAARQYLVIDVEDSGSGIPAEIFDNIFDPFFTTKETAVGTGLGLSLVHGIVTGLGGAVDVTSTLGKGSTFRVYLPRAGDVSPKSKPRKRAERKASRLARDRIMVIDDEDALVRLATVTLEELGYSVIGFTSSTKAIEAFLADPGQFDAVITDESMPGASGCDLIRKMRPLRPTMPILLLSGYLSAAVIERAHEAGASEVLKKPLPARQLKMALERALVSVRDADKHVRASSQASRQAAAERCGVGPSRSRSGPPRRRG